MTGKLLRRAVFVSSASVGDAALWPGFFALNASVRRAAGFKFIIDAASSSLNHFSLSFAPRLVHQPERENERTNQAFYWG